MKFDDLWIGDRFVSGETLWTKIDHDTARQHSEQSIALGELGHGYIGDMICSFEYEDEVRFLPPSA